MLTLPDLKTKSAFYFEVDLNSLDTGIGLRNRHMRENYLETDKKEEYRYTRYSGVITQIEKGPTENEFLLSTEGKFFVHGVEQDYKIRVLVTRLGLDSYQVKAQFEVPLTKFQIKVPTIMFYKVDENMRLALDFYLKKVDEKK